MADVHQSPIKHGRETKRNENNGEFEEAVLTDGWQSPTMSDVSVR
jgi:hypothetical protein